MWIKNIKLKNFRNYKDQEISLDKNINIFFGENAQGKTNIIEAIFMSSMGKSFRAKKDSEIIKIDEDFSIIETEYEKKDREGKIKIELGKRKNIYNNGIKIKKLSELLGNINIVIFTPDDIEILKGGPQNRRKFLDIMISQLRPNYIHILNLYSKTIEQRNNYLKQIKEENKNIDLLEIWDEKIIEYSYKISNYRKEFIDKISEKIENIHNEITNGKEKIEIKYITECLDINNFSKLLKDRRKLDIIKGYTTKGIHRDDFEIFINNKSLSTYGSQGQHRTAILTLKISELQIIEDEIEEYPILLLDDFMSELDKNRRKNLLKYMEKTQVIITCTEKLDIDNLKYKEYEVKEGKIFDKEKI